MLTSTLCEVASSNLILECAAVRTKHSSNFSIKTITKRKCLKVLQALRQLRRFALLLPRPESNIQWKLSIWSTKCRSRSTRRPESRFLAMKNIIAKRIIDSSAIKWLTANSTVWIHRTAEQTSSRRPNKRWWESKKTSISLREKLKIFSGRSQLQSSVWNHQQIIEIEGFMVDKPDAGCKIFIGNWRIHLIFVLLVHVPGDPTRSNASWQQRTAHRQLPDTS